MADENPTVLFIFLSEHSVSHLQTIPAGTPGQSNVYQLSVSAGINSLTSKTSQRNRQLI